MPFTCMVGRPISNLGPSNIALLLLFYGLLQQLVVEEMHTNTSYELQQLKMVDIYRKTPALLTSLQYIYRAPICVQSACLSRPIGIQVPLLLPFSGHEPTPKGTTTLQQWQPLPSIPRTKSFPVVENRGIEGLLTQWRLSCRWAWALRRAETSGMSQALKSIA